MTRPGPARFLPALLKTDARTSIAPCRDVLGWRDKGVLKSHGMREFEVPESDGHALCFAEPRPG